MARRIRWLGVVMVLCFVVLFLQLNNVQVVKAQAIRQLAAQPGGRSSQRYDQPRGSSRAPTASCWPSRCGTHGGAYKYERQYPTGLTVRPDHRVPLLHLRLPRRRGHLRQLPGPAQPARQDLRGPAHHARRDRHRHPHVVDASCSRRPNRRSAAATAPSWCSTPTSGAVLAMYSNPTYDPNPLAVEQRGHRGAAPSPPTTPRTPAGFAPATSLAYQDIFPAGVDLQDRDHHGRLRARPAAGEHPDARSTPASRRARSRGQTTPLCNDGASAMRRAPSPRCCRRRATPGYALLGTQVGAASMTAEARRLRLQPATAHRPAPQLSTRCPTSCSRSCYQNAPDLPGLLVHRPGLHRGQPLQMALVASGIADGGVIMTPHVMYQIRDSQNNLVEQYQPTPWQRATSPATAAAVTEPHAEGRHVGHGVGRWASRPRTTWRPRRVPPRPEWATPPPPTG